MPTITTQELGQGRRLYVSGGVETTFGGGDTKTHLLLHGLESPPMAPDAELMPDNEFSSGIATDFSTREMDVKQGHSSSFTVFASIETIPLFLAKAIGKTYTRGGVSVPYTHPIVANDTPQFLPGYEAEEHNSGYTDDTIVDWNARGISVDTFELTVPEKGFATVKVDNRCSGRTGSTSDQSEGTLTIPTKFLTLSKTRVSLNPTCVRGTSPWDGTTAISATAGTFPALESGYSDLSPAIQKIVFRWKNNIVQDSVCGQSTDAGYYEGPYFPGERVCELEITTKIADAVRQLILFPQMTTWTTQKEVSIIIEFAGHTDEQGGRIVFPLARCIGVPSGRTGKGPQIGTYTFRAKKTSVGTDRAIIDTLWANGDAQNYCA